MFRANQRWLLPGIALSVAQTRQPVLSELARRLPVTVTLGIFATIVATVFAPTNRRRLS
jgi:ABC-type dipeptide/oligopeptide/nickel transport system permease component